MNRVAVENDHDVLVTGHNLDDEAAVLFGNTLNWLTAYLQRQGLVLQNRSGLVKKVVSMNAKQLLMPYYGGSNTCMMSVPMLSAQKASITKNC